MQRDNTGNALLSNGMAVITPVTHVQTFVCLSLHPSIHLLLKLHYVILFEINAEQVTSHWLERGLLCFGGQSVPSLCDFDNNNCVSTPNCSETMHARPKVHL